jgi:hypothetical protein
MFALVNVRDGTHLFRTAFDFFVPLRTEATAEAFSSGFDKHPTASLQVQLHLSAKMQEEIAPFRTPFQSKGLEALLLMRKPWVCACGKEARKLVFGFNASTEPTAEGPRYPSIFGLVYATPICAHDKSTCEAKALKNLPVKDFPKNAAGNYRRCVVSRLRVSLALARRSLIGRQSGGFDFD